MTESPIPYPALTRRFVELDGQHSAERLTAARSTTVDELAAEFDASTRAFETFVVEEPFFPENEHRDGVKNPKSDARTFGWAMAMKGTRTIEVDGDHTLDFRYVEREIIPTRTEHRRAFEPPHHGHHLRIDLVLANAHTGRPILAELKIGADKDPFTAFVQALAAAAQCVPRAQRRRLARLDRAPHSFETDSLIDVYVLLADFPRTGRHRFEQLECAVALAALVETRSQALGRVRILQVAWQGTGDVGATTARPQRG